MGKNSFSKRCSRKKNGSNEEVIAAPGVQFHAQFFCDMLACAISRKTLLIPIPFNVPLASYLEERSVNMQCSGRQKVRLLRC